MARLYSAATQLKGLDGQTRLANALNEAPQTVNNWESRGISAVGALKAQKELGCNAVWVLTGEGEHTLALPLSEAVRERVAQLDADAIQRLENVIRAHLGMPVLNPAAPAPHRLTATPANQNVMRTDRFRKRKPDSENRH